ncbi:glucan 1,3-beta-glucosidase, putative [Phytophthora infestans T30-4]|uniref:Glucan 1,3-beta-glucosidase, putative n=1 Tax=Phytophthora infestans (strain T30-4) TaxID=403677 RepID=D0N1M9_PHYIT|nr:glucan 1,3-beta-glucosidase, putative [Phytophthora infestans T30-4]EEY68208.1 glucan 1,3-beta-glucosidase, putative [Phytophthora infestans T30-4]|eukprot:XP_002905367.1 glucan 1,3-beta-glucosidase, putative [Phytophthora infestans T30-4]
MDTYTFCTALGGEEANRQLRIHWATWVTEEDMKELAEAGVNSVRVPVGDWMFNPYEPYIGCTDGAVKELDRVIELAFKYNIEVLLDIHGLIGSQNGFDNSGMAAGIKWTSIGSTQPIGTTTFEHWPLRAAGWAGDFNLSTNSYNSLNYENLNHSLHTVTTLVDRYAEHPAIIGVEPVNEPWELTPIDMLKDYYWRSYKRVKARAPHWKFVLHDSFRFGAWNNPGTKADFFANACQQKYTIADMENERMPVIVGEWSLATDNCQMWLNGFNDNLPGFPKVQCRQTPCPVHSKYLGVGFPGTPLDVTKPIQGPYGTGQSGPSFEKCPITSNTTFGQQNEEEEVAFARALNLKKLNAYAVGHGWYFWNFKTEFGSRWNFLDLVRKGVFPKNVSNYHRSEERGVQPIDLTNGLDFACGNPDKKVDCTGLENRFNTLEERCDWAFNEYWHTHRQEGATCDFGGAAHLLAANKPSRVKRQEALVTPIGNLILMWCLGIAGLFAGVFVLVTLYSRYQRQNEYSPIRGENA